MNFLKRAVHSLWYHGRNTLLLFTVFLALAVLILSGFSMLAACRQEERALRESVGATVTVNNYHVLDGDVYYGSNQMSQESVDRMAALEMVSGCNPYSYSLVRKTEDIQPIVTPEQDEMSIQESNWLRVEGTWDVETAAEFVAGTYELLEGRLFDSGDGYSAVVSNDVAQKSGIALGDTVRLEAYYTQHGGEDVEVTVVGIYAVTEYLPHTNYPFYNRENLVYVTPDAVMQLNGPEAKLYSVRFTLRDPERAQEFVESVQAMGLPEGEDLRFTIDDIQYRAMRGTIGSMTAIAAAMLTAAVGIGAITLVLLLLISLKDRDFELGVLLSLGEARWKIAAQLILESLVPVVLAMTAAIFLSPFAEEGIGLLFSGTLTESIHATAATIGVMYLCGVLLTLLASLVTVYKVFCCRPKKILMAVG